MSIKIFNYIQLLSIFFLIGETVEAQTNFIKAYGANQTYIYKSNSICENFTGGYIMAGQRYTPTTGSSDFCVINVNDTGATQWSKTYGGNDDDVAWDIKKTLDGNFIVAGSTKSVSGSFDMYVIKIDTAGNILSSKTIGGGNLDIAYCIQPTTDSGFVLAGRTQSFGAGNEEFYLVKLNSALSVAWSKTIGNTNPDYASWVEQLPDNGFITCGYTVTLNNGWDLLLAKSDSTGNFNWKKNYGTATDNEFAYCVKPTNDGGYILAGDQLIAGSNARKSLITKINNAGAVEWCKSFEAAGYSKLTSVVVENDGYVFTGYVINNGQADVLFIKTDLNGDTIFTKAIGQIDADYSEKIIKTTDGGYAISGYIAYTGNFGSDFYLVKTDSLGNVSCSTNNISLIVASVTLAASNFGTTGTGATSTAFASSVAIAVVIDTTFCFLVPTNITNSKLHYSPVSIFPNPFQDNFMINISTLQNTANYYIYNSSGQIVQQGIINSSPEKINFKTEKGIYFLKIITKDFLSIQKLIR